MKSIAEQEEALFEEWERERQYENLIRDGVVREAAYAASSPRILFVLKEVNDINTKGWDLRGLLQKGTRSQSWSNLARWARAVAPGGAAEHWREVKRMNGDIRRDRLRSVAAMNVKKVTGGASSNSQEIEEFARRDAPFIARQFEIYDPDFTVFCGVSRDLVPQFASSRDRQTSRGIRFREHRPGGFGIQFCHPQARYPAKFMYYALADAAEELRRGSRLEKLHASAT